ncbi:hypothetical protein FH969_08935 [Miniimonas arenae]|uniref:DUF1648 domain-containing protein n=1 Tax=Miniimonas arenae TaxID=676201 RepID=A0A5C5BAP7_9MICO|nr:hypothetical protein [Miniimonas arenae]TNU73892.1 hypothetical protein FH969_08935 [Miniimonas arenae]
MTRPVDPARTPGTSAPSRGGASRSADATGDAHSPRPTPWWRRALAALVVAAPLVLLLTWGEVLLDRLPPLTPTHFGASGAADAWSDSGRYWLTITLVVAALAVVGVAVLPLRQAFARVWTLVALAWAAAFVAGLWFASALVTLAASAPGEESLSWQAFAVVLLACGWGALAWGAHGPARRTPTSSGAVAPAPLAAGERLAASATTSAPMFWWLTAATAALAVVAVLVSTAGGASPATAALVGGVLVVAAVAGAWLARITATVDARGLRVTSWLGIPVKRIPLSDVAAVRSEDLEPTQWGGWGFRWLPGRTAYVARRGPALVVVRRDGREFAVTLDDPEPLASVLAALAAADGREQPTRAR